MKKIFTIAALLIVVSASAQNTIIIDNLTGKRIDRLDYWIGSETDSQNPGLLFKSKGGVEKDNHSFMIPESFDKKKRNKIILRAYLSGGGFISVPYSISSGETKVTIQVFNACAEVPTDNFKTVIEKFKEFNFDNQYLKVTNRNALATILGSIMILDKDEKKTLFVITPKELKTQMTEICDHDNLDFAEGIFSSATSISGGVSLPFVSANTAFSTTDVAKFHWSIENAGECVWSPPNEKDLATLFSELSEKTKEQLIKVFEENEGAKVKFINRAFVIGRIELATIRAKNIKTDAELSASNFVTAKGQYEFVDGFETKNIINNIVTKVDGYYQSSLLSNLYVLKLAASKAKLSEEENNRIKSEFEYLLKLYPDQLTETTNIDIMKKQISDLNAKPGGISYLKKTEGVATVTLQEVKNQNQAIGEVKKPEGGTE